MKYIVNKMNDKFCMSENKNSDKLNDKMKKFQHFNPKIEKLFSVTNDVEVYGIVIDTDVETLSTIFDPFSIDIEFQKRLRYPILNIKERKLDGYR